MFRHTKEQIFTEREKLL